MYIDDLSIGEVMDMGTAITHITQNKQEETVHARKCEAYFKTINENATSIGMKINSEKTQLLCISDCNYSESNSLIYTSQGDRFVCLFV